MNFELVFFVHKPRQIGCVALFRDFGYEHLANFLFVQNRAKFRALDFTAHGVNHQPDS
jgi:hypothetical protein